MAHCFKKLSNKGWYCICYKSPALNIMQPLSHPDEHGANPKTKKKKKKMPSETNDEELKSQRFSKRLKTAA
ncbi:hypothetical protein MKX01_027821 [Papaver californicum]|nr:hypothetical protein MKX01_027821 [Papaver californicum]